MTKPHHKPNSLPRNQILIGDARTRLAELPEASVDCVVTSPPYYALRDYGEQDQLGLEPTVEDWVRELVGVGRQIKRVLKPTGSFWLNVADSYSHHPREGAPKKSLLLGPQRLALALVADGWIMRNHIIWAKTNPMPSNVTDRLSCTHESLYLLTLENRYFFDLHAIRQPHKDRQVHGKSGGDKEAGQRIYPPVGMLPRRDARPGNLNNGLEKLKAAGIVGHPLGGNPGDCWQLATAAFHGDHYAAFPGRLVERPILATCPERTCLACGQPWLRARQFIHGRWLRIGPLQPDCDCRAGWQPGVVLDVFLGSGTTALVAEQHGREWLGIELNARYAELAQARLAKWRESKRGDAG
jgi:site-specific DNA-methyltransferase (adenine-specific)